MIDDHTYEIVNSIINKNGFLGALVLGFRVHIVLLRLGRSCFLVIYQTTRRGEEDAVHNLTSEICNDRHSHGIR